MKIIRGAKRPKPSKTLSSWKLWKASVADLRSQWKRYIAILAIITLPLNLLNLFPGLSQDATFNAYTQIAAIIMNVALIWAIVQYERTGETPGPGRAYHEGSEAFVRFLLTSALIVLLFIPAALAAALYIAGFMAVGEAGTLAEQVILGFICLLIGSFSGWWFVRFGLAPTITVASGRRPLAALRYSRRLTMGRFWRVFGHYAALVLFIAVTAIPIAIITYVLSIAHLSLVATLFFGIVTTFTALPLLNLYMLKLYRTLEDTRVVVSKPAPAEVGQLAPDGF